MLTESRGEAACVLCGAWRRGGTGEGNDEPHEERMRGREVMVSHTEGKEGGKDEWGKVVKKHMCGGV